MDASSQPRRYRRRISGASLRHAQWLLLLCGCLVLLPTLVILGAGLPQPDTAHGAPAIHADVTATATATQQQGPLPTLTMAVPSSGQGPIGAHITLIGSNWGTSDVLVGAAPPGGTCADPNNWAQTFNHVRPGSDQRITLAFDWPSSLSTIGGAYSICATNSAGSASVDYQLLSLSAPTLAVDPQKTNAGAEVTVTGTNFAGSGNVTLTVTDGQGATRQLGPTLTPNNGSFEVKYKPLTKDVGDVTLRAFTSAPQGMRPALDANIKLHVDEALTPTVGVTPTVVAAAPPSGGGNSSLVLIVVVVAIGLLALLTVAGVIVFFVMRNRNNPAGGAAASEHFGASGPGYGKPGNVYTSLYQDGGYGDPNYMGNPGWDAPTQDHFPAYDQGGYPSQTGYGSGIGGWPESDEPDPNWRPRPMTGQWRQHDESPDASYQGAPQDPWGTPDDSNNRPGQPYGGSSRGGYPPRPSGKYPPSGSRNRDTGNRPGRGSSGPGGGPRDSRGQPPDNDNW